MKTFLQIWLFIPAIYAGLLALHTGTHLLNSLMTTAVSLVETRSEYTSAGYFDFLS